MNVSDLISEIILREGGDKFTNIGADRGGATKYGVTQATLSKYRGRPASVQDVKDLTEKEARAIYLQLYVRGPNFHLINDERLMTLAVDCGVNHGQPRAIKWLQELVGVKADGIFGPITAAAINRQDPEKLYKRLLARRVRFYGAIIANDWKRAMRKAKATPGLQDDMALSDLQAMFAGGWLNRAAGFIEE